MSINFITNSKEISVENLSNDSKNLNNFLSSFPFQQFIKNQLSSYIFDPNLKNDEIQTIWLDFKNNSSLPHSGKNVNEIRETKFANTVREITKEMNNYTNSDHGSPVATAEILKYPLNYKIGDFFNSILNWNNYKQDNQLFLYKSWKLFNFDFYSEILELNDICLWSLNTGYINLSDIKFGEKMKNLYIFWKTSLDKNFIKHQDFNKLFREYLLYENDISYWKNNVSADNFSIDSGNIKFIIDNYFINLYNLFYSNKIFNEYQEIHQNFVVFFQNIGIKVYEPKNGTLFEEKFFIAINSGSNIVKSIISPAFLYDNDKVYVKGKVML